jgi:DUF971 family protein
MTSGVEKSTRWPTGIRVTEQGRLLVITFDTGETHGLRAEYLRVHSPSAEVQGHSPAERRVEGGKRDVAITGAHATGNYAVRLVFSDGHETGIFTWDYLHRLGIEEAERWPAYLAELAAKGLKRER